MRKDRQVENSESPIDQLLLLRLHDCAMSTKVGMVDCGFPIDYEKLAALGYVNKVGKGFQVNAAGLALLREQRELLKRI